MFRCPKCKSTNLEVTVEVWAKLIQTSDPDGPIYETEPEAAADKDHMWTDISPMQCKDCGHGNYPAAIARDFSDDPDREFIVIATSEGDNDETKTCPDCGTPNQFGELCHKCTLDRQAQFEATHTPG